MQLRLLFILIATSIHIVHSTDSHGSESITPLINMNSEGQVVESHEMPEHRVKELYGRVISNKHAREALLTLITFPIGLFFLMHGSRNYIDYMQYYMTHLNLTWVDGVISVYGMVISFNLLFGTRITLSSDVWIRVTCSRRYLSRSRSR